MKFFELLDKYFKYRATENKRKLLERIRQEYLEKVDSINENIRCVHHMNWTRDEQLNVYKSYIKDKDYNQAKANDIEQQIRTL